MKKSLQASTNSAQVRVQVKAKAKRKKSVKASNYQTLFTSIAKAWSGMGIAAQNAWALIAVRMTDGRTREVVTPAQSAYQLFLTNNLTLAAMGVPQIQRQAPSWPIAEPQAVPQGAALTATNDGTTFQLLVSAPGGYESDVIVYAAPVALATRMSFPDDQFSPLCMVNYVPAGSGLDLSQQYLAKYYLPPVGCRIAIQLMPVTSQGFSLPRTTLMADVVNPAASEAA